MRKVKENRPELGGRFLILTPPMSREDQVLSGGLLAVGRGASAMGATVEDGWLTALPPPGDVSCVSGVEVTDEESLVPLLVASTGGLTRFGFVIGIADLKKPLEAIALALARWCGDREERTISKGV